METHTHVKVQIEYLIFEVCSLLSSLIKNFGLHVSGYPQTALTKQRESLEEPLKVFTLPSHQHSGFWIPGDGEETINTSDT